MSGRGPSHPFGDRPRMAEALASLKEGLRDSADPLYDGWKLPRRATTATYPDARPPEPLLHASPPATDASTPGLGESIDITLEGTPDATPLADAPFHTTSIDVSFGDDFETEAAFFAHRGLIEPPELIEPPAEARAVASQTSVQIDTVPVRIIPYQPFPRWALVAAASLLVFAASVVAMRAGLSRDSSRSSRSVLASEVPRDFPASSAAVATAPPPLAAPPLAVPTAAPSRVPRLEATTAPAPVSVSAPSSAGKIPSAPVRRRPGTPEFFRDPGF